MALWLAVGLGRGYGWHSQQAQLAYADLKCKGSGHDSQRHLGSVGKGLEEMRRSRCLPWGHLCIFLEHSRFWKVAWFSLPLKGVELGTVAAWRMTFILVA